MPFVTFKAYTTKSTLENLIGETIVFFFCLYQYILYYGEGGGDDDGSDPSCWAIW